MPLSPSEAAKMPVVFAAHGAPMLLDDPVWMRELAAWAEAMPKPTAILSISGHWEARPATLGPTKPVPLFYDFYGFPKHYYDIQYPAPGAPSLATHVRSLLGVSKIPFADHPTRGHDHGTYIPLLAMYPDADIPLLSMSLPGEDPNELFALGKALAKLRAEGVLIFTSGFLTHNMRYAFQKGTPAWARDFDEWVKDALVRFDEESLLHYRTRAPGVDLALPTREHFTPLLVALGAASLAHEPVTFPVSGFWMDGAFTRRSVQFG